MIFTTDNGIMMFLEEYLLTEPNTEKDKLMSDLSQLAMEYLNQKQFNNLLIVAEKLVELKDEV